MQPKMSNKISRKIQFEDGSMTEERKARKRIEDKNGVDDG
jgi:hypothetical protein